MQNISACANYNKYSCSWYILYYFNYKFKLKVNTTNVKKQDNLK